LRKTERYYKTSVGAVLIHQLVKPYTLRTDKLQAELLDPEGLTSLQILPCDRPAAPDDQPGACIC
jgi:hypothetical protein